MACPWSQLRGGRNGTGTQAFGPVVSSLPSSSSTQQSGSWESWGTEDAGEAAARDDCPGPEPSLVCEQLSFFRAVKVSAVFLFIQKTFSTTFSVQGTVGEKNGHCLEVRV